MEALRRIQELYAIEAEINGQPAALRQAERQTRSKPLLDAFHAWAVAQRRRGIAVTRKNFLFLGSDRGGDRAAAIYTIIESAKLNGLDPEAYLATILDRLARGHPISRLDELLPWNYTPPPLAAAA